MVCIIGAEERYQEVVKWFDEDRSDGTTTRTNGRISGFYTVSLRQADVRANLDEKSA